MRITGRGVTRSTVQWTGLLAGPALAVMVYLLLPEAFRDSQGQMVPFTKAGRATAAVGVWMAAWWMTEALPIYATSLIPLAVLPIVGAAPIRDAAAPYAHELIFLFMGGFMIALSMQRWDLHTRFALAALKLVGSRPQHVVGGFMAVTALISMWVSNTATAMIMLPIAVSVIDLFRKDRPSSEAASRAGVNFGLCLLLGIAYSASIGGVGTLIGTAPNLFLASYANNNLGLEISFLRWLGVGLPFVAVFLPVVWLLMTRIIFPIHLERFEGGRSLIREAHAGLGPMKPGEWAALAVFLLTALAWIFGPLLPFEGLTDTGVAMIAALVLFAIPVDVRKRVFVMDWETAAKVPWEVLILFGGGLSLAAAIQVNGVAEFLGNQAGGLAGLPAPIIVILVTALVIFLTELMSNTACAAILTPIFAALAPGLGLHPLLVIVPTAIAASCAFMLPVGTPPNALIFGTGWVTIPQMCKAGLWLNLIGIALITALTYFVALPILGAPITEAPGTP